MKRQRGETSSFKAAGKRRKSYVVHKERETWTDEEHAKFVLALEKYGRTWQKIEEVVGTKTVSQIRSHAQKYFEKLERQGDMEVTRPVDGNAIIDIPWIALPDVLSDKNFILDKGNFQSWMEKNHLGAPRPSPPSEILSSLATSQTNQAISFLDRAMQSVPTVPVVDEKGQQTVENEKVREAEPQIDWNRILKYIGGLAMESLDPNSTNPKVTIEMLSPSEREILRVLMTQNVAAVSLDSIRTRIEHFINAFDQTLAPSALIPSTSTTSALPPPPHPPSSSLFPSGNPTSLPTLFSPSQTSALFSNARVPISQLSAHDLTNSMELFSNFVQESSVDLSASRDEKS